MESKRLNKEDIQQEAQPTSFSQLIDDDLKRQLMSVGPRARKHVSEGHLTKSSAHLSYTGLTTGTLSQEEIRKDYLQQMAARPAFSTGDVGIKRLRNEDDDEYGDTDDDEAQEMPSVDTQKKIFYRPYSFNSVSSQTEDFEEADFLRARR